jgi:hypothetical protein
MAQRREGFARIERRHVEAACQGLLAEGGRGGGSYFVRFGGVDLPAKRVLREAYRLATGSEISASQFSGGVFTQRVLEALGVEIIIRADGRSGSPQ